MGVQGLWKLLSPTSRPVTLESLENKILAIDVSVWLYQSVKGLRDSQGRPLANSHLIGLFNRICKLLFYRIRPIFVFDGRTPILKKQTLANRRHQKNVATKEAKKISEKILENFIRSHVLGKALGKERGTISLPSTSQEPDLYQLPPVPVETQSQDTSESEVDNELEEDNSFSSETQINLQNLSEVDIDSEEFLNLPTEIQHEILVELKETSKRHSWRQLDSLPSEANDFSSFQLQGLMHRNKVQQRIAILQRQLGAEASRNMLAALQDQDSPVKMETQRVVSEDAGHYILIKGINQNQSDKELSSSQESSEKIVVKIPNIINKVNNIDEVVTSDESILEVLSESLHSNNNQNHDDNNFSPKNILNNDCDDIIIQEIIKKTPRKSVIISPGVVNKNSLDKSDLSESWLRTINTEDISLQKGLLESLESGKNIAPGRLSEITEINKCMDEPNHSLNDIHEPEETFFTKSPKPNGIETNYNETPTSNKIINTQTIEIKEAIEDHSVISNSNKDVIKAFDDKNEVRLMESDISIPHQNKNDTKQTKSISLLNIDLNKEVEPNNILLVMDKNENISDWGKSVNQNVLKDTEIEIDHRLKLFDEDGSNSEMVNESPLTEKNKNVDHFMDSDMAKMELADTSEDEFIDVSDMEDSGSAGEISNPRSPIDPEIESSRSMQKKFEGITIVALENLQDEISVETHQLHKEHARQERIAANVTEQMNLESQELLRLFGIPYIVSPTEAEAQCAFLDATNQTHGTITEDSDIWLFGGKRVYKNFFNQKKQVEVFTLNTIGSKLGLDRDKMINIALLTGSDYTEGILGVGTVTAMEILSEFCGNGIECLKKFRTWWVEAKRLGKIPPMNKVKAKLYQLDLHESFPNPIVMDGYLKPDIDTSTETFSWNMPDLEALREFTRSRFRWDKMKTDDMLLPILKKLNAREKQTHLDSFFSVKLKKEETSVSSKRVARAIKKFRNIPLSIEKLPPLKTKKPSAALKSGWISTLNLSENSSSDSDNDQCKAKQQSHTDNTGSRKIDNRKRTAQEISCTAIKKRVLSRKKQNSKKKSN